MTIEKAIKQLDWYFHEDDGGAAEKVTKRAYETLKKAMTEYDLDDLNAIYTCALRYSFGRMTYMPGLVTDYIKRHADTVTDKELFIMTRDLREEIETAERVGDKHYGMDCDKRTWLDFYAWLLEEKGRRDADREK